MPMLERSAASLEPCSLQRILPSTSGTVKSHRRLHTGFWQHGAADLELSNAWHALLQEPLDPLEVSAPMQTRPEPMTASTFLLDFLYPNGAAMLLRRLAPGIIDRDNRPRNPIRPSVPRSYMSSATSMPSSSPTSQDASDFKSQGDSEALLQKYPNGNNAAPDNLHGDRGSQTGRDGSLGSRGQTGQRKNEVDVRIERLYSILKLKEFQDSDRVWGLYQGLPPEAKATVLLEVFLYLAASNTITDAGRLSELYSEMDHSQCDSRVVPVTIQAEMRLGNVSKAASIFQSGMIHDESAFIESLVHLISHSLYVSTWDQLYDVWMCVVERPTEPVFSAKHLNRMASAPRMAEKLNRLFELTKPEKAQSERKELFASLRRLLLAPLAQASLVTAETSQAVSLLRHVGDPLLYEEFIRICIDKKQKSLASDAYREYRQLPGVKVRVPILQGMIRHIFYPHDAAGMELVLKDWYKRYGHLDIFGYQKFLAFYAMRGDVSSVNRMWEEFARTFKRTTTIPANFTPLLQVHAVRGDVEETQRVFQDMWEKHGVEPTTVCWNILLNAYCKARDYDGAIKTFTNLCEATRPDDYSFGTVMGLSGSHGDLDYTLELYRMAKDRGIKPTVAMVDSVIEAYCQNDRFKEAESLCFRATKGWRIKGNYTSLWNTLLFHHAMRRDLHTVNNVLSIMTELDLPYDDKTYDCLLVALIYCRQSHQALQLLQLAHKKHVFRPTHNHYVLLMSAFLESGEPRMALKTSELLDEWGFPKTSDRLLRVIQALGRYQQLSRGSKQDAQESVTEALRQFRRSLEPSQSVEEPTDDRKTRRLTPAEELGDIVQSGTRFDQLSSLMFIFAKAKDFITTQDLIKIWNLSTPDETTQEPPLRLLSAILLAHFQEGNFDAAKESWTTIFEQAKALGRPGSSKLRKGILPRYQYILVDPLKTMQRMYEIENDAQGLLALIEVVTRQGFKLDSKNWNYHVQILARMKRWKEAFSVCEEVLMPQWTGWYRVRIGQPIKNQLPLSLRRIGSSPEYLRPTSHTLLTLAGQFVELDKMTLWSGEASRLQNWVLENCRRVLGAIKSLRRSDSQLEDEIFGDLRYDLDISDFQDLHQEELSSGVLGEVSSQSETGPALGVHDLRDLPKDYRGGEVRRPLDTCTDARKEEIRLLEELGKKQVLFRKVPSAAARPHPRTESKE